MIVYFSFNSDHDEIIKRHEAHWIQEIPPDLLAFRGVLIRFFIYFLQM